MPTNVELRCRFDNGWPGRRGRITLLGHRLRTGDQTRSRDVIRDLGPA